GRVHWRRWPTLLGADLLLVEGFPNLQADLRHLIHSVVDVAKKMIQKSLLPSERLLAIEGLPFLPSMSEQPLFPGGYPLKRFDRPASVQSMIRPTSAHQCRYFNVSRMGRFETQYASPADELLFKLGNLLAAGIWSCAQA